MLLLLLDIFLLHLLLVVVVFVVISYTPLVFTVKKRNEPTSTEMLLGKFQRLFLFILHHILIVLFYANAAFYLGDFFKNQAKIIQ